MSPFGMMIRRVFHIKCVKIEFIVNIIFYCGLATPLFLVPKSVYKNWVYLYLLYNNYTVVGCGFGKFNSNKRRPQRHANSL